MDSSRLTTHHRVSMIIHLIMSINMHLIQHSEKKIEDCTGINATLKIYSCEIYDYADQ
ncbi:unnamed protein product, partial [Rotaria sp. Silwood2]